MRIGIFFGFKVRKFSQWAIFFKSDLNNILKMNHIYQEYINKCFNYEI